jgi:hypothetical protein
MNNDDKYFTYDALNLLEHNLDNMISFANNANIEKIIIVPFKINFNCTNPFNTILLINNFTDILTFPSIDISCYNIETNISTQILSLCNCYLYSILLSNGNLGSTNNDFDSIMNLVEFKGFYVYENNIHAFIDLTKLEINTDLVNKKTMNWFVLIDEIINKQTVCNIPISEDVVDFFMNNSDFIYFKNFKEELIEVPSVLYTGTHEKSLHFNFTFGNTVTDNNGIVSSGFYFTNFNNAFRQGGWSLDYKPEFKYGEKITNDDSGKYSKGGIIRYAVFLGKQLIKQNLPNDTIDESEIKRAKLNNALNNDDYHYEKMTLRISDHDGLWKQKYDSVYLGKIELDNGKYLKNVTTYVIKDYHNHFPLSYHYIDETTLGDIFDENSNYQIM